MEQTQAPSAGTASNITLNTGEQLDPKIVKVMRTIRSLETGTSSDPYNQVGDNGHAHGAYQFNEKTGLGWKGYAQKYLGDSNAPMTPANQNKAMYSWIKEKRDEGLQPDEIDALHNGAHKDPATGRYVHNNQQRAQAFRNALMGNVAEAANGENPVETPQKTDLLEKAGNIVNTIFPGKQVGQAIGTLAGYIASPNKDTYDTSAPGILQTAGDVAQGALMVGTGMPEETGALKVFGKSVPVMKAAQTTAGRIGQAGLIGAGFGATGGIKEGKGLIDIGKDTAMGGVAGGVLGGAGELAAKAAQSLPKSIVRKFIPGINEKTTAYAVNKGLGSPEKMLEESNSSIKTLGNKLGAILKDKKYSGVKIDGQKILTDVAGKFGDSGLSAAEVADEIKKLVPLKKNLVDKLSNGNITLDELHQLNSALGGSTFKTVFDDPAVKAGKEVGSSVYHTISDLINETTKDSAGKSATAPLFDELSKEYQLNPALKQVIRRGQKARTFTLRDLVALTSGFGVGGPAGAIGTLAAEKALVNPSVNLKTAGLVSKLGSKTAQQLGRGLRAPIIKGLVGGK